MPAKKPLVSGYLSEPAFAVVDGGRGFDRYRLKEGRLEFRASGQEHWRSLDYPDIYQHFSLDTAVGKWLAYLNNLAQAARSLAQD